MNMSMGVGMFGDGGGEWEREGMRGGLEEWVANRVLIFVC